MTHSGKRAYRVGIPTVLALLVALAWLALHWPTRSLWYDETVNAYFAGQSWSAIWEWCTEIDNQMPLHFVLLKLWASVAGTSEFALRAFSFLAAGLVGAGVFALGRRLGGQATGSLALLAFVLSQSTLYAAFEVRPYALALVLFVWASVVLWELWKRYADGRLPLDRQYAWWIAGYLGLALALVYTHYTAWMALAVHGLYLGWRTLAHPTRRRITLLAHLELGLVLGYLPWVLALAGRDVRAGTAYAGQVAPGEALQTYLEFYAHGQYIPPTNVLYTAGIIALVIGALLVAAFAYRRDADTRRGVIFATLLTLIPLAALVLMVYAVQAKLSGRHGWPAWLGAALLIGLGLSAFARWRVLRWPVWAAALLVIVLPQTITRQPIYNSYLREAFEYVASHAQPGDVLFLRDGTLFTAAEYYDTPLSWAGLPPDKLTDVNRFLSFHEALDGITALVELVDAQRAWVIAWQGYIMDPQDLVSGVLEGIGNPQPVDRGFGDVHVSLYELNAQPHTLYERVMALEPVAQAPNGPTYYGGYALGDASVAPGGTLPLHTWWRRGETVIPGLRVSVRLMSPDGTPLTQIDQPPVAWAFGQDLWPPGIPVLSRFTLPIPADIPPGPADVTLVMYDVDGTFDPITAPLTTVEIGG